jgi:hypothetical protein
MSGFRDPLAGLVFLPCLMDCSPAVLAQRIAVTLREEQAEPLPDNHLIAVLCDSARLIDELLTANMEYQDSIGEPSAAVAALETLATEADAKAKRSGLGMVGQRPMVAGSDQGDSGPGRPRGGEGRRAMRDPLKTWPAKDQCLFCGSRRCHTSIVGPGLDEVACGEHGKALEILADIVLPNTRKMHTSGGDDHRRLVSATVQRHQGGDRVTFGAVAKALAEAEARP